MSPERKAEVNRLLAEFEGHDAHVNPHNGCIFHCCGRCCIVDYAVDLNALARLEGKLPPHTWDIDRLPASDDIFADLDVDDDNDWSVLCSGLTEAEARAEAIAQYLEGRKHDEPA